jgi:hypothetical protein
MYTKNAKLFCFFPKATVTFQFIDPFRYHHDTIKGVRLAANSSATGRKEIRLGDGCEKPQFDDG